MKKLCLLISLMSASLIFPLALAQSANEDMEGCKDYPLFNRMPNFHIIECQTVEFDARKFPVGPPLEEQKPKVVEVEGKLIYIQYQLNEGANPASGLQIMRNFENATRRAGGTIQGTYPDWCKAYVEYDPRLGNTCTNYGVSMKFVTPEKEIWAYMQVIGETGYGLQIIEREKMKQDIVVNAEGLQQGLTETGHIAVYDILFDTGKSDVKPESDAALKEIAKLMGQKPSLKLHVVGHTDNVGDLAANMKLSQARAAAVVAALTAKHGVAANRLNAFGAGPYAPVASNANDEGKAKNRRVELVEQ
ncbi:MAG: OmpA family protein [Acidobacteria bacterium]|nr:MAG: OmpA family protein [Acidobacteriota bacterium]